ncbi:MAG TPA: biopolymer transporter ExbD [Burkholderiales bacterium]|nr:biopolymer transporter ExbD [Burkholderiales bacterium]
MALNFQRDRPYDEPEVNLIPMIDVLLVIVIFLAVTTTYSKYSELKINLPTAEAETQQQRPNEIDIAVDAAGRYRLNRTPISFSSVEDLAAELGRAAEKRSDTVIIISADAQASHQSVIHVMEAARLAGLSRITFTTQTR